jgi:hypothetical protein
MKITQGFVCPSRLEKHGIKRIISLLPRFGAIIKKQENKRE